MVWGAGMDRVWMQARRRWGASGVGGGSGVAPKGVI